MVEGAPRSVTVILKDPNGNEIFSTTATIDVPPRGFPWNSNTYREHHRKEYLNPELVVGSLEWHWTEPTGPSGVDQALNIGRRIREILL